ncbi:MAG: methylglyoxal synthase [Thermomicrobiales bacterium]|nr:MAG: methylglyoxal synthase [Thermomicrobiales bacterium]
MHDKRLALIAHDGKKAEMIAFVREHRAALERLRLIGTATTARLVREETGLPVESVLSGPLGGDVQIAAGVATGEVGAVIFLVDPLNAHPHDPDIQAVLRVCNVHNVPLATNLATARLLLNAPIMDQA